ncbi:MAG: hypothetical protein GY722_16135, partial [bacterium]|nr:hypothetical protein [bacterium]
HKFTGHERDYSNLTDYMLGRTYLYPKFRFASPDPARDGWNLYAYVGNNPVNLVDPTGLAPVVPARPLVSYETASEVRDDVAVFLQDIGLDEWAPIVDAQLSTILPENNQEYVANATAAMFGSLGRLRDARGRFVSDPASPPSPYKFTDAQRRAAWRSLADDPNSGLTAAERAQVRNRGNRGPQRVDEYGELETMELSHEPVPLRKGGTNVVPRWPADHAAVDPHRYLKNQ